MSREAGVGSIVAAQTGIERLAQLFPRVSSVRLPVRVFVLGNEPKLLEEQTVIEFGTAQEILFSSTLPLEFEDRLRILNSDGSFDTNAKVVAVSYHDGRKAVAARFLGKVENWIIKP